MESPIMKEKRDSKLCSLKPNYKRSIFITAEIQRHLFAANIFFITGRDLFVSSITVNKSEIIFDVVEQGLGEISRLTVTFGDSDFHFQPYTLSGLTGNKLNNVQYKFIDTGTEISFRLQLEDFKAGDKMNLTEKDLLVCRQSTLLKNVGYLFTCGTCAYVLGSSEFERILEFPTNDLSDSASEWFCHAHGECGGNGTASVKPQGTEKPIFNKTDCILGVSTIYFCCENLNICNAFTKEDNNIFCSRCLTLLGEIKSSENDTNSYYFKDSNVYLALFKHSVYLTSTENAAKSLQKYNLNQLVLNLIEQQDASLLSSKLCLETELKSKSDSHSVLLWVMKAPITKYFKEITLTNHLKVNLDSKVCVKVLYCVLPWKSAHCRTWRSDFNIEVVQVHDTLLWEVVDLLQKSTATLPPSQRIVDNFNVGFLESLI